MAGLVVVMPTMNSELYLVEAVTSVLRQTFADLTLLILDGGSTDATLDIIGSLAKRDPRIEVRSMPGLSPSARINEVIRSSDWKYLAMAHSDDISLPDRIAQQMDHMTSHPDVLLCGGQTTYWLHEFSGSDPQYFGKASYPLEHEQISAQLPFWWAMAVPTVILNLDGLRARGLAYDTSFEACSDWMMNWNAARAGRVSNIPETLIAYRHHLSSHGPTVKDTIHDEVGRVRSEITRQINLQNRLSPELLAQFLSMRFGPVHIPDFGADPQAALPLLGAVGELDLTTEGLAPDAWREIVATYTTYAAAQPSPADDASSVIPKVFGFDRLPLPG